MPPSPIFIVGSERSGTTVFRLMLDHHPELAVCSEFEYVVDGLEHGQVFPDVDEYCDQLEKNWIFQDHNLTIDRTLPYEALVDSFLEQVQTRSQAQQVLAVVHRNFDQLLRLWPNARYIHIVRDPRDVARSVVGMGWAGNVWYGVERWLQVEEMWNRMKAQLPGDRYFEISLEELVQQPALTLQAVCRFIGVGYSAAMLDYPKYTTYAEPDPSLIYQWQRKLTAKQIALVESRTGDLLQARGYSPSAPSPSPPSILEKLWLKLDNKLGQFIYRIRMLGVWLFISDFLSRKLRIRPWQAYLEPQLASVWRSNLK
jgi:hypothetical protein